MGEWIGFSIMLLFSIGCYVLSGFFLHGKGACLIAGYNTMSKKEQWTLIAGNIGFCSIVALVTLGNLLFSNTKAKK